VKHPSGSTEDLLAFLRAAPSPYHAVDSVADRLSAIGFEEVTLDDGWTGGGNRFVRRDGALVAWATSGQDPATPFRIVGAHTDSPNLRLKPKPDCGFAGWRQLGVEVYGGALWNSWLDRDLGLSGRVVIRGIDGHHTQLVSCDRPLARVPQLAIHLDRDVNGQGLRLNPQAHLTPVWGTGPWAEGDLARFVAAELGVDASDVVAWDLMFHDLTPPTRLGCNQELVASARLDNLLSCWAGTTAISAVARTRSILASTPVLCLYDHEEVGSASATGADSVLLPHLLERIVAGRGGDRQDFLRALAGSVCASVDMAHATHPNHPERHDPAHHVAVNAGPVMKINANQRYATSATSHAVLIRACEVAGVPHQVFVSRNDQPCGSTIGPVTAARLGIDTVDVGVAQLSMHSARELCGAEDPPLLVAMLDAFLRG
jgi:aspartyl aminopeptidase